MLFDDHNHFFERSVACSFSEAINSTLYLSRTINNTLNRICCCKAEIIVAMTGNNCFIDI